VTVSRAVWGLVPVVLVLGVSFTAPVAHTHDLPTSAKSSALLKSGSSAGSVRGKQRFAQGEVFGHSVQGRALVEFRMGPLHPPRRILVVGVIHGDETAGLAITRELLRVAPVPSTEVVVVPDLNPDGVALGTRQNFRGVDLNRNFPYRWRSPGRRGDPQYPGKAPLSEPESRSMAALVRELRPTASVWFHQPVGVVDESGGSVMVATVVGLPLRRMQRYNGSAVSWQNVSLPRTSAFVVELPRRVSASLSAKVVRALQDLEH